MLLSQAQYDSAQLQLIKLLRQLSAKLSTEQLHRGSRRQGVTDSVDQVSSDSGQWSDTVREEWDEQRH